jgi:hypothetical protein
VSSRCPSVAEENHASLKIKYSLTSTFAVELRGLEPLTRRSMPWWPDKVWRRAASRDRVHTRPCAARFMQAGSPHSAPQFEPPRRNRRGHSRLVSSPREHLDTSADGVPVCAGQRPRGRSAAADANAPRWVVKPAQRKLLAYTNVFVECELRPRVVRASYTCTPPGTHVNMSPVTAS